MSATYGQSIWPGSMYCGVVGAVVLVGGHRRRSAMVGTPAAPKVQPSFQVLCTGSTSEP